MNLSRQVTYRDALGFIIGVMIFQVLASLWRPTPEVNDTEEMTHLRGKVVALEEQLTQQRAERCMVVSTEKLVIDVYPTPHLGVKKVSKP